MDTEDVENTAPSARTRQPSSNKMKVLVRSHAMREESPPPSPLSHHHQHQQTSDSPPHHHHHHHKQQPSIKLIPSPEPEPGGDAEYTTADAGGGTSPMVVLSPSPSVNSSPSHHHQQQQRCLSPAGTLVPSSPASRASSNGHTPHPNESVDDEDVSKYTNNNSAVVTNNNKLPPPSTNTANNRSSSYQPQPYHYHHPQQPPPPFPTKQQQQQQSSHYRSNSFGGGAGRKAPPPHNGCDGSALIIGGNNTLTVQRARGKLKQQSSSQGSFESSYNSPCLSRDSSSEQYTDTTGVDLEQFIPETLNRNAKDRALMLRIEQELVSLAKDRCKTHYKFPPMSSYQRMLVHRCAAYFGMDHNIESGGGKSVIVNKTKNTRIPETEFKEFIREDVAFAPIPAACLGVAMMGGNDQDPPRRSILKRDSNSVEDYSFKSPDRSFGSENRRSKSFEEREEEYEKARRRIFNREHMHDGSSEDFGWSEMPWSSTESDCSSRFRLQPPDCHRRHFGKLIKVHSEDAAETLRPYVAKSYSFGGYGGGVSVLSRGDSVMSTHSAGPRLLTKQDSGASSVSWRLSPSSSGYKSQSQMSESVTPSPTSTPHQGAAPAHQLAPAGHDRDELPAALTRCDHVDNHVVWAVTDIQNVPLGSIIIDPQTGKPLKNDDGTIYHYDPHNLPPTLAPQPIGGGGKRSPSPPPSPKHSPKEEIAQSPKKKYQPNVTNSCVSSSTSPSLPFTPPPQPVQPQPPPPPLQRTFSYEQQQFGNGAAGYASYTPENGGVYAAQSYVLYAPAAAPYGLHHLAAAQYDARMESASLAAGDLASSAYYVQEGGPPPAPGQMAPSPYQPTAAPPQPAYWNHQPMACFYQNGGGAAPAQRYAAAQPGFLTTSGAYQTGFANASQAPAAPAPPPPPELVQLYPGHQPVQVVYHHPNHQPPPPAAVYPQGQPQVIYATSQPGATIYPSPPAATSVLPMAAAVPPAAYPQGTPTPNSCASQQEAAAAYVAATQLAHGVQQLTIAGGGGGGGATMMHAHHAAMTAAAMQHQQMMAVHGKGGQPSHALEYRPRPPSQHGFVKPPPPPNGGKYLSRQSSAGSGGTNSPAGTVVAAPGCAQPPPTGTVYYKTPPSTPPATIAPPQQLHFAGYPAHPQAGMFAQQQPPALVFKQMGNMRIGTPGTARSSRSPTPAGDMSHLDRQRMTFPPPNIFQGVPYVMPGDPRLISAARSQPNMFKQSPTLNKHQSFNQCSSDSRTHKNKKPNRGNKQSGLPPSGK